MTNGRVMKIDLDTLVDTVANNIQTINNSMLIARKIFFSVENSSPVCSGKHLYWVRIIYML